MDHQQTYDYVIVGSGFGGSVSAMRLSEKGYRVLVLERGKRYRDEDLPKTNWNLIKYLWLPALRCFGILQMSLSKGFFLYHSSGVGGGSLVYAAVLMKPGDDFFKSSAWSHLGEWSSILNPHYETARRMLGVAPNPRLWPADNALREIAEDFGFAETFRPTELGVFFGEPDVKVPDPYFDGKGPIRVGCTHCGACITGCRVNAKNTLPKNYLYFAEQYGALVTAERLVHAIYPLPEGQPDGARYEVHYNASTAWFHKSKYVVRACNVILSAGVLGTLSLLLNCRDELHSLPNLSRHLGERVRTNSEAFFGGINPKSKDRHCEGLCITSVIHADEKTQIEPVRFSEGSSMLMWALSSPLIEARGGILNRLWHTILEIFRHPIRFIDSKLVPGLSKRGLVLLVMQTEDNQMRIRLGRNPFTLFKRGLVGDPDPERTSPVDIDLGNRVIRAFAEKIGGYASGTITEGVLNVPMTAHMLGGCAFGRDDKEGVIGLDCQVHNYPGLYVVDGSIIPANPGINPTLTITALAEYAMSQVPQKGG